MRLVLLLAATLAALPAGAEARTVTVRMLDNSPDGGPGFSPALVRIEPGDSVQFVAADHDHTVESRPGMIPAGADAFAAATGQTLTVTFTKPGLYGYKCGPHYAIGMVGLVQVGDRRNEAVLKAVAQPGMAQDAFQALFTQLDTAPAPAH